MGEGSFGKDGDATQTEQKWISLKLSILICLEIRKVAGVARCSWPSPGHEGFADQVFANFN